MSYFEDCIEPYIGDVKYFEPLKIYPIEDTLSGDTINYTYESIIKETEKAYLITFSNSNSNGDAWIPKSMIYHIENNVVSIYEEFRPKYINKVKTIKLGDIG